MRLIRRPRPGHFSVFGTLVAILGGGAGCRGILGIDLLAETDDHLPDAAMGAPDATSSADATEAATSGDAREPSDAGGDTPSPNVFAGPPVCAGNGWCWAHPLPQGNSLYGLWGTSKTDVWAVGDRETLLHFDGRVWSGTVVATGDEFPTGGTLYGVWSDDRKNAWAVGAQSNSLYPLVLRHDGTGDAGVFDWQQVVITTVASTFNTVWGDPGGQYVLAGGSGGTIFRFNRATFQWSLDTLPTSASVRAIGGSSAVDVWAVGDNGTVLAYAGGGIWRQASLGNAPPNVPYAAIWSDRQSANVWITGSAGTVLHGNAGGFSQVVVPNTLWGLSLTGVWGDETGHVWVTGRTNFTPSQVFEWDGASWSVVHTATWTDPSTSFRGISAIWGSGASDLWTVGINGAMAHGEASGWTPSPNFASGGSFTSIWGSSLRDIWVGGYEGATLRWNGSEWSPISNAAGDAGITTIWGTGPNDVYSATSDTITHYDGAKWSVHTSAPDAGVNGVWGSGPNDVWAAGADLRRSIDGGPFAPTPFAAIAPPAGDAGEGLTPIEGIWGSGPNDVWAVGGSNGATHAAYAAHFDGQSWTLNTTVTSAANGSAQPTGVLYGVTGAPSGEVFFSGEFGPLEYVGGSDAGASLLGPLRTRRAYAHTASDVWFVAPNPTSISPNVTHWDGGSLSGVTTCTTSVHSGIANVWGNGGEVWAVGSRGNVIRHP